jgi:hypothetical protein
MTVSAHAAGCPARRTVEITDDEETLIVAFIPADVPKTSGLSLQPPQKGRLP